MALKKDYSNIKKFKLTALEYSHTKEHVTFWKFACDCGNIKIMQVNNFIANKLKSCGCQRYLNKKAIIKDTQYGKQSINFIDITGNKYNQLIALNFIENGRWLFKCDCGKVKNFHRNSVVHGRTKSCGCLRKGKRNLLPPREAALNVYFSAYKGSAKHRKKSFQLTIEDFKLITSKDCYYCGQSPQEIKRKHKLNYNCIANGIDRINNDIGYELNNCVPACIDCNKAKSMMSKEQFLNFIKRVYNFNFGDKSNA